MLVFFISFILLYLVFYMLLSFYILLNLVTIFIKYRFTVCQHYNFL